MFQNINDVWVLFGMQFIASQCRKKKRLAEHVRPSCFNIIRPLKKDIQIPVPSSRFLNKIQIHRIASGSQNTQFRQFNKTSIKSSKKYLNSFMAFRAYYSQFGSGVKQNVLSSLLAEEWHADKMQHGIWDYFAQQYNFINPGFGFYVVTDIGKMCLYIWPYRVWSWRRLFIFRVLNVVSIAILFETPHRLALVPNVCLYTHMAIPLSTCLFCLCLCICIKYDITQTQANNQRNLSLLFSVFHLVFSTIALSIYCIYQILILVKH
ncbi:ACA_G0005070.mRNA.1.CDS.1 [Saccharomyces cerevisiae]|nr:ACA_G0005070.mRNA.1.CDS.1 [Saccharomyces cerevisiae]CAI6513241.1 ACA_G0005070.mRNA.1.CDS.1 [Saccharomyces cerevisiae]